MRLRRDPVERPWLFVAIAVLYAFSIPWWFGEGRPALVLGLPSWVVVSLVCTLAVSVLVAFAALRLWDDEDTSTTEDESAPPKDGVPK